VEISRSAKGVSVNEGAMQLTRILLDAISAAKDFTSPSTADFAADMLA
jgi:hypothetical protein